MSLAARSIWRRFTRMSAVRLSLTLGAVFVLVLLVTGWALLASVELQVRSAIDDDMGYYHSSLQREITSLDDIEAIFDQRVSDEEAILTGQGYRSAAGQILGPIQPHIFDDAGFHTVTAEELFTSSLRGSLAQLAELEGFETLEDEQWRIYVAPLANGTALYYESIDSVEEALVIVLQTTASIGLPILATTLLFGVLLGWQQQRRLDRIRDGIEAIAEGRFDQKLAPERARDDLDDVMVGVDAASAKLEHSFTQLRAFSQNVAHELRTPLARLRAQLEDVPGSEPALMQTDEVIRIFEAVQRIARLTGRASPPVLHPVDLGEVARMIADLYADVSEEDGHGFDVQLDAPATVQGDLQLIAQLVSNLVENALRHAGEGAKITLRVAGPELTVQDSGRGVNPAQLERMFTPFEQFGDDRSGSGLGLALVRAIAQYHGAEISAQSRPGKGVQITTRFPRGGTAGAA